MSDTEIPSWCTAAKVRAAMPGTPSMPLPVTVSSACFGMAESAFTGYCSRDRKSTRLNSSHANISYAVFCLKKKNDNVIENGLMEFEKNEDGLDGVECYD